MIKKSKKIRGVKRRKTYRQTKRERNIKLLKIKMREHVTLIN